MELEIGTKIRFACALGTLEAIIENIRIAPTAKPGVLNTWLSLILPVQDGVEIVKRTRIAADNASLKMYRVEIVE